MAFSPNSLRLAVAVRDDASNTLLLIDIATATTTARGSLPFAPSRLGFGGDGATLVVYGQPRATRPEIRRPARVLLSDAAASRQHWQTPGGVVGGRSSRVRRRRV